MEPQWTWSTYQRSGLRIYQKSESSGNLELETIVDPGSDGIFLRVK